MTRDADVTLQRQPARREPIPMDEPTCQLRDLFASAVGGSGTAGTNEPVLLQAMELGAALGDESTIVAIANVGCREFWNGLALPLIELASDARVVCHDIACANADALADAIVDSGHVLPAWFYPILNACRERYTDPKWRFQPAWRLWQHARTTDTDEVSVALSSLRMWTVIPNYSEMLSETACTMALLSPKSARFSDLVHHYEQQQRRRIATTIVNLYRAMK